MSFQFNSVFNVIYVQNVCTHVSLYSHLNKNLFVQERQELYFNKYTCLYPHAVFYSYSTILCIYIQKYHVSVFTYNNNNTENSVLAWIGILNARSEYFAVSYIVVYVPYLLLYFFLYSSLYKCETTTSSFSQSFTSYKHKAAAAATTTLLESFLNKINACLFVRSSFRLLLCNTKIYIYTNVVSAR